MEESYPVEPEPMEEFAPELAVPPAPTDLPPAEEGAGDFPEASELPPEGSNAPLPPSATLSANSGFRIIGPLDIDLTDTRPAPFITQSGAQITLVSGTQQRLHHNQIVPGGTQ